MDIRQRSSDLDLLIARGNVPGVEAGCVEGRNAVIAAAATEVIWDASAGYVFPATALMVKLSQTVDQSALRGKTIEIVGLDANWLPVTQTKELHATLTTTAVVLDTPLIRVNSMRVLSAIVTDSPVRLHNSAESQDYAVILAGNNATAQAVYTVPAGKTAFITYLWATINQITGAIPTVNTVRFWSKDNENGYAKMLEKTFGLTGPPYKHRYSPYRRFLAKTDLYFDASPVTSTADVSAGFDLILVAD